MIRRLCIPSVALKTGMKSRWRESSFAVLRMTEKKQAALVSF